MRWALCEWKIAMNYNEYKEITGKEVRSLNQKERVALCLIFCARLFPLYSKFSATEGWGDEVVLCQIRQMANNWLCGSVIGISAMSKQLSRVIPDSDDFGSVLGSYALNAGAAHDYLLEQTQTTEHSPLLCVLQYCYDTIDCYVQEVLDPDCKGGLSESEIESHEAMIKEIDFQLGILSGVKGKSDLVKFVGDHSIEPIFNIA